MSDSSHLFTLSIFGFQTEPAHDFLLARNSGQRNLGLGLVTEYIDLPARERAAKYPQLAEGACKEAERVKDRHVKEGYVLIAERWEEMACDVERRLLRGTEWGID
jgi:hypothetical protein